MKNFFIYMTGLVSGVILTLLTAQFTLPAAEEEETASTYANPPIQQIERLERKTEPAVQYTAQAKPVTETHKATTSAKKTVPAKKAVPAKKIVPAKKAAPKAKPVTPKEISTIPKAEPVKSKVEPLAPKTDPMTPKGDISFILAKLAKANNNSNITYFNEPGDCVTTNPIQVQEVIKPGYAMALEVRKIIQGYIFTTSVEMLVYSEKGASFYDEQVIKLPQRKCFRQIGIYKYVEFGHTKTVPIVMIAD